MRVWFPVSATLLPSPCDEKVIHGTPLVPVQSHEDATDTPRVRNDSPLPTPEALASVALLLKVKLHVFAVWLSVMSWPAIVRNAVRAGLDWSGSEFAKTLAVVAPEPLPDDGVKPPTQG